MTYEWKKQEKALYLPKQAPEIITVPRFSFFMIKGAGNPNDEPFAQAVGVLYALAYAVKMSQKKGNAPAGYYEYAIYPLEGVWSLTAKGQTPSHLDKNELAYTIMIRQPDFVTEAVAGDAIQAVKKKKPHPLLEEVTFGSAREGLCVQMLHAGPYDTEPLSFAMMERFCVDNGYKRTCKDHREIYLADARKAAPDKLRTVLRYSVEKTGH